MSDLRSRLLIAIVVGAMLVSRASGQQPDHRPQLPPAAVTLPTLPADLAGELARAEQTIDQVINHPEDLDSIQTAIPAAQHVLDVRTARQGAGWWETVDARCRFDDLRLLTRLPADERRSLAAAWRQTDQVSAFQKDSKYQQAIDILTGITGTEKRILGESHRFYANSLQWLGFLHQSMGHYDQAKALYREALEIERKVFGEQSPDYAGGLRLLAAPCFLSGSYAEAEPLLRQALEIRGKTLGERSPDYAQSLDDLAGLYKAMGRPEDAEPLLRQAQDVSHGAEPVPPAGAPVPGPRPLPQNVAAEVARDEQAVADAVGDPNDLDKIRAAIPKAEHALAERRTAQGDDWWEVSTTGFALSELRRLLSATTERRAALAETYRQVGQIQELEQTGRYHEEVESLLAIMDRERALLGKDHPYYASAVFHLAVLYDFLGQYEKAEPLFREALEIRTQVFGEHHPDCAEVLDRLGSVYNSTGRYDLAERTLSQALRIRAEALGKQSPDYARSLNDLGVLYSDVRRYRDAEPLFRQAMEIFHTLGERSQRYAASLQNLASVYRNTGRYKEAEPLYRQAIELNKSIVGEKDPAYAASLNGQATLYQLMGRYAEAEPLYREVLEIEKNALGEEHPKYSDTLNNLGLLCKQTGRYNEAEPLLRKALEIRRKVQGEQHPLYAQSLGNLAQLYRETGRYTEAEQLIRQALAIRKKLGAERDPDYAASLDDLAGIYCSLGRYPEAETIYKQALDIRRKAGGEDGDYASDLSVLATLYVVTGRFIEAESLRRQALDIRRKVLGEDHPDYAASLDDLGGLYALMGRSEEAEPLLRQALEIRRKVLGEQHPDYAASLDNIANLNLTTKRYAEAERLYRQALEIRGKTLGKLHPEYAESLDNLASVYEQMQRYAEAEPLFQQALEIRRKVLGEQHPDYATSEDELGYLRLSVGRYDEADVRLRQALEIRRKVLGEQHPAYASSLIHLGLLYFLMGRYEEAEPLYRQALDTADKFGGEQSGAYSSILTTVGVLYQATGRYAQAESTYRRVLEIEKRVTGEQSTAYAEILDSLGRLCMSMGRYDEAEPPLLQALEIRRKVLGDAHPKYAESLHALASLRADTGHYDEAETLYRQALEIQKKVPGEETSDYAGTLEGLAGLYALQGRYEQAEPLYERVVEVRRKVLGAEHPRYAASLDGLATADSLLGRSAQAEPLYREALALRRKLRDTDCASTLNNLAVLLAATNRRHEAALLLAESEQADWRLFTSAFPEMTGPQKRQFLSTREFKQNDRLWTLALQSSGAEAETGLRGLLFRKQLLFEAARQESGALQSAVASAPAEWQASWRKREQERREYATLALAGMSEKGEKRLATELHMDPARIQGLASDMERLDKELRETSPAYASQARLQEVTLEDLRHSLREGEALVEYSRFDPYDFSARKWGNTHYGAFVLQGGGPVAAIDLGDAALIDTAIQQFQSNVRGFIDASSGIEPSPAKTRSSEAEIALASSDIRARAWQPLESHLSGVRRVYVAPDGLLSLIPFEALAREDGAGKWRYLVEDRELIYLGTGRDLGRLALSGGSVANEPRTAVLIGDPAFDAKPEQVAAAVAGLRPAARTLVADAKGPAGSSTLGSIAGGAALRLDVPRPFPQAPVLERLINEASRQLRRLGWSVTTLTGAAAVEEEAENAQAPRILQFATHGYIMDRPNDAAEGWDNPLLRSMLILAGANDAHLGSTVYYRVGRELLTEAQAQRRGLSPEQLQAARVAPGDGLLTAYEVTGMNLQGTDLVNLTACETGLGEVTPDGVAGLRQAFLLAGARSLTVSMWEVPADETTAQISDFYDRWLGGAKTVTRYEAFHAAQLEALARARQNHGSGHPFYWAGVVYVGDPGDLPVTAAAQAGTGKQGSHE